MSFRSKLEKVVEKQNSLVCVGLDPDPDRLPRAHLDEKRPLYDFCRRIIRATADSAAAFKLNLAFFEVWGSRGWEDLEELLAEMPDSVVTIADGKRGDIGNSSRMYAKALFESLTFDSVTVSPYLGLDSVEPFLADPDCGAFVLCRTSNPGRTDFQDMVVDGEPLYIRIAEKLMGLNGNDNLGFVVGAAKGKTDDELARIRKIAPDIPILLPGVGAQGGDLEASVKGGIGPDGKSPVLINSSRSIIFASDGPDFAEQARTAAEELKQQINQFRP